MPTMLTALARTPLIAGGMFFLQLDGDPTNLSALSPVAADDDQTIQAVWGRSLARVVAAVRVRATTGRRCAG